MMDSEDGIGAVFQEMLETGRVCTSSYWIEKATEQKNHRLTMDLACSKAVVLDIADKLLFAIEHLN